MFIDWLSGDDSRCLDIRINTIIAGVRRGFPHKRRDTVILANLGGDVDHSQIQKIDLFDGENTTKDGKENDRREKKVMFHSYT